MELEGKVGLGWHLARRLFPLTLIIGIVISTGLPGIYYFLGYTAQTGTANVYARELSERLQRLVVEAPALWKYQASRYNQIIGEFLPHNKVTSIRVLDEAGRSVPGYEHTTPEADTWWNRNAPAGSAPILFNDRKVGTVQVMVSRGSLLGTTLVLFLFSSTVGVILAVVVYSYPVRVVRGMEGQVQGLIEAVQSASAELERRADEAETLLEVAETRAQKLKVLYDVAGRLAAVHKTEEMLSLIVNEAARLLNAEAAGLRLVEGEDLVLRAQTESAAVLTSRPRIKVGESLSGHVVATGAPVVVEDLAMDTRYDPQHKRGALAFGVHSFLGVPLKVHGETIGTLHVYTKDRRCFTSDELSLLSALADQASISIEKARLYQSVQQAYDDLLQAQNQLVESEKVRALGAMAGGVAHDFNNLLATILGRAQYLLLRMADGEVTPEEVRKGLAVIERKALQGAETVRRLQELTLVARPARETAAVGVNDLLTSVVAACQPRWKDEAEAKGAPIEVVLDARGVTSLAGNAAEIREALLNLVFNAIEAMPQGGTLTLSSWAEDGAVYLAVRDTGVGIPEEVQPRIFDPFFTTKGPQVSGLGLSVASGVIRRHGGAISVESREGHGTTFTIRLPVREAPPSSPWEAPEPAPHALRVLVIDDDDSVREILGDLLRAVGHEVCEAGSGPEGIKILEGRPVDLVLTDLGMPGMTGWEVSDRIKARWPEVAVGLITGWGAGVEPEEMTAHGVDFLIGKPFHVAEIRRVLSDVGSPKLQIAGCGVNAD